MTVTNMLEYFWHPVCTRAELEAAVPHPLAVRLLGRDLAIADVGGAVMAAVDRCPHRSTRLSVGFVEPGSIRCAYHGWRYSTAGECVEIPATPDGPLPVGPCLETFDVGGRLRPRVGADRRIGGHDDPRAPGLGRHVDARPGGRAVHVADLGAAPGRELRRPRALRVGARRHAGSPRRAGPADSGRAPGRRRAAVPLRPARHATRTRSAVRPFALPDADAVHRRHRVPPRVGIPPAFVDDGIAARRAIVPRVLVRFAR